MLRRLREEGSIQRIAGFGSCELILAFLDRISLLLKRC